MKSRPSQFNGALIVDKPAGITSHDVVYKLRKILNTRKIGHTGTLDPFATGVLVMLVGKATRLAKFVDRETKSYEAIVEFGFETDTGDREGAKTNEVPDVPSFSELKEHVQKAIPRFTGEIEQVPPMYSAKKVDGKKLYELARKGVEVERKPIHVNIYDLGVSPESFGENRLQLNVTCSAGTYVRTLAEDLGRSFGVPCHLSELRRTKAGEFDIGRAITLKRLEELSENGKVAEALVTMSDLLGHFPQQIVDEEDEDRIAHGMKIDVAIQREPGEEIRLVNDGGELLAVGSIDSTGMIQPKVVLSSR